MNLIGLLTHGDGVSQGVAFLLLAMSVSSWVVIVWKTWLLRRAVGDVARSTAVFWQSASIDDAMPKVQAFDRVVLVVLKLKKVSILVVHVSQTA